MNDYTDDQVAILNAVRERETEVREALCLIRAAGSSPRVSKEQVLLALDAYMERLGG